MAKLSAEEEAAFKRLKAKQEAPDAPPVGRHVNVNVDLGDDKQVQRAIRMGLLDDDSESTPPPEEDEDADETPNRPGYFGKKG